MFLKNQSSTSLPSQILTQTVSLHSDSFCNTPTGVVALILKDTLCKHLPFELLDVDFIVPIS